MHLKHLMRLFSDLFSYFYLSESIANVLKTQQTLVFLDRYVKNTRGYYQNDLFSVRIAALDKLWMFDWVPQGACLWLKCNDAFNFFLKVHYFQIFTHINLYLVYMLSRTLSTICRRIVEIPFKVINLLTKLLILSYVDDYCW